MKRVNFSVVLFMAVVTLFTSCSEFLDKNSEPITYGDAMIRVYKQGDSILYNRVFYAYSSAEMDSVTVRAQNSGESFELDTVNFKYTYAYLPDLESYMSTPPESDLYNFDVVFSSQEMVTVYDYLDDDFIEPIEFENIECDSLSNTLYLKWESVENADYNRVLFIDSLDNVVFDTGLIDNSYDEMWVKDNSSGWINTELSNKGDLLQLMTISYLYESSASRYDIQCMAINDENYFKWGIYGNYLE